MRLIISEFLRTLRERDEFDRLLPDLLMAMGYVPLAKPQIGVRQYGVDLAAVGKSPTDGVDEILLLVIKQGDLGRRDWDNPEPTSIRSTINEVLDFYLTRIIAPEHVALRKVIVLATTGDLKQAVETNWTGFKEKHLAEASFDFWGADKVSDLIERYMLDETLFAPGDRADLRKCLALAADPDYDFRDFNRLLLRQLGLNADGTAVKPDLNPKALQKAMRRIHLAASISAHWAQADGDSRQAVWISERTILWAWHRLKLMKLEDQPKLYSSISGIWDSYRKVAATYFEVVSPHIHVRDGMTGYASEGAAFSIVLFEHIGLISVIGIGCLLELLDNDEDRTIVSANIQAIADSLCALIDNHTASSSPRLDNHIIDINLALIFLISAGRRKYAQTWLADIARRLDYCFSTRTHFPVSTDSLDDLVELEVNRKDSKLVDKLMRTSWSLATVTAWCAILGLDEHYEALSRGAAGPYKNVCAQLWHPVNDWHSLWYFKTCLDQGDTEAPYVLLPSVEEMRQRFSEFLAREEYDWVKTSPSIAHGLWVLDFMACRHFRMPVPASAWYRLLEQPASEKPI